VVVGVWWGVGGVWFCGVGRVGVCVWVFVGGWVRGGGGGGERVYASR